MTAMPLRALLAGVLVAIAFAAAGADIVLSPPAGGGVAITNAAGSATRFRVADDGTVNLPGLGALPGSPSGLCVDGATGKVGTCTTGGTGTVTSIAAGTGLTGGTITASGTIGLASSYQLPQSCSAGQFPSLGGGGAWTCTSPAALGTVSVANGGTGQTSLAQNGVLFGQGSSAVGSAVGFAGQVLVGTAGAPTWSSSPSLTGNLTLADTTLGAGAILKNGNPFLHNIGFQNTFVGSQAGNFTMTGGSNAGSGARALLANTTGNNNTAGGALALTANTTGNNNTAHGTSALAANVGGNSNTAAGSSALAANTSGNSNAAFGAGALIANTTGSFNTATGPSALNTNTIGANNTASGLFSLFLNSSGNNNTALGAETLHNNSTGNNNIAVGYGAGYNLTSGNYNIHIGHFGSAAETNTIRLGDSNQAKTFIAGIRGVTTGAANAIPVLIDANGQLGTASSSRRVKEDIADLGAESEVLMRLRPVSFRYKSQVAAGVDERHYGLVAEEVAEVAPALAARDAAGNIETVKYHFLAPMLVAGYQRQERTIRSQAARIEALEQELAAIRQALGLR